MQEIGIKTYFFDFSTNPRFSSTVLFEYWCCFGAVNNREFANLINAS